MTVHNNDDVVAARPPAAPQRTRAMEPERSREGTLTHVIEMLLDKGLVINADIMVSVAGVELLGIRIRAALASFETAAQYGLEFPAGTDRETVAWKAAIEEKETCPQCGKRAPTEQLLNQYCPWCGWESAQAIASAQSTAGGSGSDPSDTGTGTDAAKQGSAAAGRGNQAKE